MTERNPTKEEKQHYWLNVKEGREIENALRLPEDVAVDIKFSTNSNSGEASMQLRQSAVL